jgi:hypothetical protein
MTHAVASSWLFVNDGDYLARLAIFAEAVEAGRMELNAYTLMGNHEHLLVSVEHDCLAGLMQSMNRRYAGKFNQRHRRRGRVYRSPYESVLVASGRHMIELTRYLALNPEIDGFGQAEEYAWSSYPALIGRRQPLSFIDPTPLLEAVGGGRNAIARLEELVADGRILGRRRRATSS